MMIGYDQSPLLASLRGRTPQPDPDVREQITTQLIQGLENYYAHLPMKRAAYAIDPVQSLRLLRSGNGSGFLRKLLQTITSLRDRHTTLKLASPWTSMVAYVPFILERVVENHRPRCIVTQQLFGYTDVPVGATVTHWNGVPIELELRALADASQGANTAAAMRLGLANLSVRPLAYVPMPHEDWVALTFIDAGGVLRTVATPWRYLVQTAQAPAASRALGSAGQPTLLGLDEQILLTNRVRLEGAAPEPTQPQSRRAPGPPLQLNDDGPLRYGRVRTRLGDVAYLRIFSFDVPDAPAFVGKVASIIAELPQDRLLIDIRGNPGGLIPAGQGLIRLLKRGALSASPLAFRATEETHRLSAMPEFEAWRRSLALQLSTAQGYSQSIPVIDYVGLPEYRYPGKVALIIDALCYSTSDFIAADFADNGIGPIIGTDASTGGGGANVWSWDTLVAFSAFLHDASLRGGVKPASGPLQPLIEGYSINLAVRLSLRTGVSAGLPVEDLGVAADAVHALTVRDLLDNNADLIEFAAHAIR